MREKYKYKIHQLDGLMIYKIMINIFLWPTSKDTRGGGVKGIKEKGSTWWTATNTVLV